MIAAQKNLMTKLDHGGTIVITSMNRLRTREFGFALPTVMIASVVMLILLLSGLTATSSINNAIRGQYNNKLAKEAADAGVRMATACIRNRTVHTSGTIRPETNCTGGTVSGASRFVIDSTNVKTRFEVAPPVEESYSDARYYNVNVTGYAEFYRTGSPTVRWKTITEKVSFKVQHRSQFASLSQSGSLYVCGIINQKTFCWGRNVEGQLGSGGFAPSGRSYEVDGSGNPIIVQVVRNAPGTTYHDSRSDLNGSLVKDVDVAAGAGSTCIISTSNADAGNQFSYHNGRRVACWGDSPNGELGRGIVTTSSTPYPKLTYQTWANQSPAQYPRQIVATNGTVCVITNRASGDSSGNTWCWGANGKGQLGRGHTNTPYASPGRVRDTSGSSGTGIVLYAIAGTPDAQHLCGRTSGSQVVCWGFNRYGQVGDNTDGSDGANDSSQTTQRFKTYPSFVVTTDNERMRVKSELRALAVGGRTVDDQGHSCAVGQAHSNSPGVLDGRIYCWGSNVSGQLGRGSANTNTYRRANLVTAGFGGTNYSASLVANSNESTCAVVKVPANAAQSSVYCWGSNGNGEVGVNTTAAHYASPTRVSFFDGMEVTDINGGAYRFCAVADQSNYCWGRDHVGQVGDGVVTNCCELRPSLSKFLEPDFAGLSY